MLLTGVEDLPTDVVHVEVTADNKLDEDGVEVSCAVETAEADDDNDEFVEWNEGDGTAMFYSSRFSECTLSNTVCRL